MFRRQNRTLKLARDAWNRLAGTGRFICIDLLEAIGNAVRSGQLPIRGKRLYDTTFTDIGQLIPVDAKVDVLGSRVNLHPFKEFMNVEIDLPSLENRLCDYAVPNGLLIEPAQPPVTKANALKAFERWLKGQVDTPVQKKKDVLAKLRAGELIGDLGKEISRRSCDRAWTDHAPKSWTRGGRRARLI